ncbi:MAG: hypothetical protein ACN6PT_03440 [Stenotrophomonas geniculata]
MSNDIKTLENVQPGGRVRLGDQAERARFEAWAHAQSYRGGNIMADRDAVHPDVYADPIAQLTWKSWKAALSAQPSPGGQDVLFIEELAELRRLVPSVNQKHALDAAIAALAARQPVETEENVAADTYWTVAEMIEPHIQDGALPASVHDSVAILLDHWLKTRQPVGEPFGYCADFDPGAHEFSHTFYYLAPGETVPAGCTAFYAGPPAQAVDLGQFREAIESLKDAALHDRDPGPAVNAYNRVLALIDSQAVGK